MERKTLWTIIEVIGVIGLLIVVFFFFSRMSPKFFIQKLTMWWLGE